MRKILFCMGAFLCLFLAGCSNDADDEQSYADIVGTSSNDDDEQSYADIVGTWELVAYYILETVYEVPEDERDLFVFNSNEEVMVVKNWESYLHKGPNLLYFPNEAGEYEYSYDKEKQIINFMGKTRKCIISGRKMRMEGYYTGPADGTEILHFIFIKK